MFISDILYKKRNGEKLSSQEIDFLVSGYTKGVIPDYQMSAFLMAAFINGLDEEETIFLTKSMTESGRIIDLSDIKGVKIDKHSTGGVGDGTSLVISPLVACHGVIVPMIAGRGLGHTGGTIDKLESIPGFRVNIRIKQYKKQLDKIGAAIIGQTEDVAPADKKIYALRDVTATVDSISLISASIMSKKLAEGCDGLVLDVKVGSGAFMKTLDNARKLSEIMLAIGNKNGKKIEALLTNMHQPLGNAIGNALEIKQAIDVMNGSGPEDFKELVLELSSRMLVMGGVAKCKKDARNRLENSLNNGDALKKFSEIIKAQGGDTKVIDYPAKMLLKAKNKKVIVSDRSGYISSMDASGIGNSAVFLGAGRIKKEDNIDHYAGIILHKKVGDRTNKNEPIATLYYNKCKQLDIINEEFLNSYKIIEQKPKNLPLIYN